jgi:hypothetical protein
LRLTGATDLSSTDGVVHAEAPNLLALLVQGHLLYYRKSTRRIRLEVDEHDVVHAEVL